MNLRELFDETVMSVLRRRLPGRIAAYLTYQHKRVMRREIEARLRRSGAYGDEVQSGPFRGMKLPARGFISCRFEKIIGAYEHELHPIIRDLASTVPFRHIVNVGAADGYFSTGFGMLFPTATVVAYEMDGSKREVLKSVANLNGVSSRLVMRERCDVNELEAVAAGFAGDEPVLVLCDVDGYETELLDTAKVEWLKRAFIIVELHDCLVPGVTETIRKRFEATHSIKQVTNAGLPYAEYPALRELLFTEIYAMVAEDRRGLQDWFLMRPK